MLADIRYRIQEIAEEIKASAEGAVLLSEIAVSDGSMDFIHSNLYMILNGPDTDEYCIVSAYALMDVGTRNYEGKELWPGVERECNETLHNSLTYTGNDHRKWFDRFKKGVTLLGMEWNFSVGRIQVDNILVHTFVPDVQLDKFIKFVDGFYNNILGGSLDGLEEYLPLVPALVSRSDMKDNSEYASSVLPDPSLNKSTKKALSNVSIFKPLLTRILNMVHSIYTYDRVDESDFNRYYKAFNDYLDSKSGPRSHKRAVQRISAHLELRDGVLYIILPEKICNQEDELLILQRGKRIPASYQPLKFTLANTGKCYVNAAVKRFDELFPGLSPSDDFQLVLGSVLWRSSPRRKFLLFDWNGKQINKPIEGEIGVYSVEETHIEPEERIVYRREKTVYLNLKRNDVLTVGDQSMKVRTESVTETDILYDTVSDAVATDSTGNPLDLVSGDEILCEIAQPAEPTYVLRVKMDEGETAHIQINKDSDKSGAIMNYYRDNDECSFSISPKTFGEGTHIVTVGLYELNTRKLVEKRFLFAPDLDYGFDKRVYCTPEPGRFFATPLDDDIEFSVSTEYVEWDLKLPSEKIHFRHTVPSATLSLDNGRTWIYPPYAPVPFMDLNYDHILVRNGAESDFRLSCTGIVLPDEVLGKDRKYDLTSTKKRILSDKYNTEFAIYYPASGKSMPTMLFRIITKNEYLYDKQSNTVVMHNVSGMKAVARYSVGDRLLKEFPLSEGINDVGFNYSGSAIFTILEFNYLTDQFDILRLTEHMGKDISCVLENGKVYIINLKMGKKLELLIDPGASRQEFENCLLCMIKFNKWLNDSRIRQELWNSFESLKGE